MLEHGNFAAVNGLDGDEMMVVGDIKLRGSVENQIAMIMASVMDTAVKADIQRNEKAEKRVRPGGTQRAQAQGNGRKGRGKQGQEEASKGGGGH